MKRCLSILLSVFIIISLAVSASSANGIITTQSNTDFTDSKQTTKAKPALSAIQDLEAYKTTSSSITIHWKDVENADGYAVYIFNESKNTFELTAIEEKSSCTISSLSSGSTYRFKVEAIAEYEDDVIRGKASDALFAVTACEKVKTIVTSDITKSSISLSWSQSKGATSYEVWIYNKEKDRFVLYAITQETNITVTDLFQNTLYNFKIRAVREDQNAVAYSNFSAVYTDFTDTSGTPYTKSQAAKLYNTAINSAKQADSLNISYSKEITTKTISCSKDSLLRTVKNIMNLFNGKISEKHNFSSGKDSTTTINQLLEPYKKSADARGCDILKFSVSEENGETALKLVLKPDKASYNGKTSGSPSRTGRVIVPPALENIKTSPIKIQSAEENFKSIALSAQLSKSGELKALKIICNTEIDASCRVSTIKFQTTVSYKLSEVYKIN